MRRVLHLAKGAAATLAVGLAVAYTALLALGLQPMAMATGSMTKTIPVGSLVVDRTVPPSALRAGDVISFRKPLGSSGIATHRIIAVERSHGVRFYRTKGDSNLVADPWSIVFRGRMQAHRVAFHVPYLGYALLFARSKLGILLVVAYLCFAVLATLLKAIAQGAAPDARQKTLTLGDPPPFS
jgi:signal peptidase I